MRHDFFGMIEFSMLFVWHLEIAKSKIPTPSSPFLRPSCKKITLKNVFTCCLDWCFNYAETVGKARRTVILKTQGSCELGWFDLPTVCRASPEPNFYHTIHFWSTIHFQLQFTFICSRLICTICWVCVCMLLLLLPNMTVKALHVGHPFQISKSSPYYSY